MNREVAARLVPDPHGRPGHWYDAQTDSVYSLGDYIPEGIDPEIVPSAWSSQQAEPVRADPNEIERLQKENEALQATVAQMQVRRELESLTVAQLKERAFSDGITVEEKATKADIIAILAGETNETSTE